MKPLVVGLTGGVATGKSTVARLFAKLGARVHNCDRIAHQALKQGTPTYREVKRKFRGLDIWNRHHAVERRKLASVVFRDAKRRRELERIVHPFVFDQIRRRVRAARKPILIFEVPLLYETHFDRQVDCVIVVACSRASQIERIRKKFRLAKGEAERRLGAQWPLQSKVTRADFVVDNGGSPSRTRAEVKRVWRKLRKLVEQCH